MDKQGAAPLGGSPEEMSAYLKSEIDKYAKVMQASVARADQVQVKGLRRLGEVTPGLVEFESQSPPRAAQF